MDENGAMLLSPMNTLVKRTAATGRVLLLSGIIVTLDAIVAAPHADAFVARRTTVVGRRGVYHHTAVRVGRPAGIYSLPAGYRAVTIAGAHYYTAGGVYYRRVVRDGETTYVVANVHP